MEIREKITADVKSAMLAKDSVKLNTLLPIRSVGEGEDFNKKKKTEWCGLVRSEIRLCL